MNSQYSAMWLVTLFDLPTDTPQARRAYRDFHNLLIKDGFIMIQFSVYARYCSGEDKASIHRERIRHGLPPDGEVRIMTLTDIQYGKMKIFYGKRKKAPEKAPQQIELF